jgi:hypothetical protein
MCVLKETFLRERERERERRRRRRLGEGKDCNFRDRIEFSEGFLLSEWVGLFWKGKAVSLGHSKNTSFFLSLQVSPWFFV